VSILRVYGSWLIPLLMLCSCCWGQSAASATPDSPPKAPAQAAPSTAESTKIAGAASSLHLTPLEVVSTSETANGFLGPFVCDADGNLYLRSESAGVTAIRKLNAKGERVALYEPGGSPDVKVALTASFTTTPDGEVYVLVYPADQFPKFVMVFAADGSYKSQIKLDTSFAFFPTAIAVFPNGSLLVSGQRYDRSPDLPKLPFTGIFRSDGKLLKQLDLEDDNSIRDMGAAHDPKVTLPQAPTSNRAIALSQVAAAKDGNLYLMRWLSPAVFYAISPGGEVVRHFAVDPGNPDYRPFAMHIVGNRIAVLFYEPQTMEKIMKIVDLEGHELASYDELRENGKPARGMLGLAFACYTNQPERFTFLVTDDKHQILLKHAGAR
jgi:hypothetical protein